MTSLGEQLGLGGPAEQDRIDHDLRVLRKSGVGALRAYIDGHPVPPDLYIAAVARLDYRDLIGAHPTRGWGDLERRVDAQLAHDEAEQIRKGGNR